MFPLLLNVTMTAKDTSSLPLSVTQLSTRVTVYVTGSSNACGTVNNVSPGTISFQCPLPTGNFDVTVLYNIGGETFTLSKTSFPSVTPSFVNPTIVGSPDLCSGVRVLLPTVPGIQFSSNPPVAFTTVNGEAIISKDQLQSGTTYQFYTVSANYYGAVSAGPFGYVYRPDAGSTTTISSSPAVPFTLTTSWAGNCAPTSPLTYAWTLSNGTIVATTPTVTFAPFSINENVEYVTLTVTSPTETDVGSDPSVSSIKFSLTVRPPVLTVKSTGFTAAPGSPITLDASASTDPDTDPSFGSTLTFSWVCTSNGNPCTNAAGSALSLASQATNVIPANTLAVGTYVFRITLTSTASRYITKGTITLNVIATIQPIPSLTIKTASNLAGVDPTQGLVLSASVDNSGAFSTPVTYAWSSDIVQLSGSNTYAGTTKTSLGIKAGALDRCGTYSFTVTASVQGGNTGSSTIQVTTACNFVCHDLVECNLYVTPPFGQFVSTQFQLRPYLWSSVFGGTTFSYYYTIPGSAPVFIAQSTQEIYVKLPPLNATSVIFSINVTDNVNSQGYTMSAPTPMARYVVTQSNLVDTINQVLYDSMGAISLASASAAFDIQASNGDAAGTTALANVIFSAFNASGTISAQQAAAATQFISKIMSKLLSNGVYDQNAMEALQKASKYLGQNIRNLDVSGGKRTEDSLPGNIFNAFNQFLTLHGNAQATSTKKRQSSDTSQLAARIYEAAYVAVNKSLANRACGEPAQFGASGGNSMSTSTYQGSDISEFSTEFHRNFIVTSLTIDRFRRRTDRRYWFHSSRQCLCKFWSFQHRLFDGSILPVVT